MEKLNCWDRTRLKRMVAWGFLAMAIGLSAGVVSALFLFSVNGAITFRKAHPWAILLLPAVGFFVAWLYKGYGKDAEGGNNLILDEIHEPKKIISWRMFPLIFLGTTLSHFSGASVGREGAAVQMGGSIADQFAKYFGFFFKNRRVILMMGMSAGFASVFGAPIAGAVFGLEVLFVSGLEYSALLPCLIAAIFAFYATTLLGITHTHYFYAGIPTVSLAGIFSSVSAGMIFGLAARFFSWSMHELKDWYKKNVPNELLPPLLGGFLLVALYYLIGSDRYHSLGEEVIRASFNERVHPWDFAGKIFMTVLSVGSGFRGGEVMSLFYIGATLGNALSLFLPLGFPVLSALGFVGVFAGATNAPLTSVILSFEFFGPGIAPYAALAITTSYFFSGGSGIYRSQRPHSTKI